MAEKTEDLKLPLSVIGRLMKECLPEGVIVSKEARTAVARAASVFILHSSNFANESAAAAKRKTITGQDVIQGISELDYEELIQPVMDALDQWKIEQQTKKAEIREKKKTAVQEQEPEPIEIEPPTSDL